MQAFQNLDLDKLYRHCLRNVAYGLWGTSKPIAGTLAEQYLRGLGLRGPFPDTLGYCPSAWCAHYGDYSPSLIAPIHDNGKVVAISQTFLCAETLGPWRDLRGNPITETFGWPGMGAAMLTRPDVVLGLAPTPEAALAASEQLSLPVWSSCGLERLGSIWLPHDVTDLILFVDPDSDQEAAAAMRAKKRYRVAGRNVTIQSAPSMARAAA